MSPHLLLLVVAGAVLFFDLRVRGVIPATKWESVILAIGFLSSLVYFIILVRGLRSKRKKQGDPKERSR